MFNNKIIYKKNNISHTDMIDVEFLKIRSGGDLEFIPQKSTLVEKYYDLVDTYISVNNIFNIYKPFISVHPITSAEELEFYIDYLLYTPLTKKYYYNNISVNTISSNGLNLSISLSINLYTLKYNNILSTLYYDNIYLQNNTYLSTLEHFINFDFTFLISKANYPTEADLNITTFITELQEKLNCILFDDFIIYDSITNNKNLIFLSDTTSLSSEFTFSLESGGDKYITSENSWFTNCYNISNWSDGTNVLDIALDYGYEPLYKNWVYINDLSSTSLIKKLINIEDVIPSDDIETKLNNIFIFTYYDAITTVAIPTLTIKTVNAYLSDKNIYSNYIIFDDIANNTLTISSNIHNNNILLESYTFDNIYKKYNSIISIYSPFNLELINEYIEDKYVTKSVKNIGCSLFRNTWFNYTSAAIGNNSIIINNVYALYNYKKYIDDGKLITSKNALNINNRYMNYENSTNIHDGDDFTLMFYCIGGTNNNNLIIGDFIKCFGNKIVLLNSNNNTCYFSITDLYTLHILRFSNNILNYECIDRNNNIVASFDGTGDCTKFDCSKIFVYNYTADVSDDNIVVDNIILYNYKTPDIINTIIKNRFISSSYWKTALHIV